MASKREESIMWWIFFVLGMGTLLPWNFFITPYQYWIEKLNTNQTDEAGNLTYNDYQIFWSASLGVTTMGTNFVMCFATSLLMNVVPRNVRFYVPMFGIAVCFGIAALMTQMDSSEWVPTFFVSTMANVIVITAFCAVFQSSLFGHAAEVGGVIPAVMGGQGAGGVFACVIDLISKAMIEDITKAVCMYFVIAVIFMFISAFAYRSMQPMASYQHRLEKEEVKPEEEVKLEPSPEEEKQLMDEEKQVKPSEFANETAFQAIKRVVWPYHVTLVLCFTVTLSVFPAVVATYKSVNHDDESEYYTKYFSTIWIFLMFNVFDFIGRFASEKAVQPGSALNFIKHDQPNLLMICAAARFIFIPLFMKCNVAKTTGTVFAFFAHDIVFIAFMAMMSFSNGFLSSLAMVYGPQSAPEHVREQVGGYLGTTLVFGLLCGASLSFVLTKVSLVF